jgi:hypothetical protein
MNDFSKAFFALPELRDHLREERAGASKKQPTQATTSIKVAQPFDVGTGWAFSGEPGAKTMVGPRGV